MEKLFWDYLEFPYIVIKRCITIIDLLCLEEDIIILAAIRILFNNPIARTFLYSSLKFERCCI